MHCRLARPLPPSLRLYPSFLYLETRTLWREQRWWPLSIKPPLYICQKVDWGEDQSCITRGRSRRASGGGTDESKERHKWKKKREQREWHTVPRRGGVWEAGGGGYIRRMFVPPGESYILWWCERARGRRRKRRMCGGDGEKLMEEGGEELAATTGKEEEEVEEEGQERWWVVDCTVGCDGSVSFLRRMIGFLLLLLTPPSSPLLNRPSHWSVQASPCFSFLFASSLALRRWFPAPFLKLTFRWNPLCLSKYIRFSIRENLMYFFEPASMWTMIKSELKWTQSASVEIIPNQTFVSPP